MTESRSRDESLKPCPFCGGKAKLFEANAYEHLPFVMCDNDECPVMASVDGKNGEEAAEKWNRRTASESGVSQNDKRWRFLEHGCQWVSWTPTGGETHSFDPRDTKHLEAMRKLADETLEAQVRLLREEAAELERRFRK